MPTKPNQFYYSDHSKYGAKYCACGCGQLLSSSRYTYKIGCHQKGSRNLQWKGGRIIPNRKRPYIYILKPDHPFATKAGYIAEHRFIMEQHLGRLLKSTEAVHHKNKNVQDNQIENLKIIQHGQHTRMEKSFRRDYLIQCLKDFYLKHGHTPKSTETGSKNKLPGRNIYRNKFGSWKNAIIQSGLPYTTKHGRWK